MQAGQTAIAATASIPIRFSHVAFTVPREVLTGAYRQRVTSFFSEVFGFVERPQYTKDGQMLVMMAGAVDQFVVLFGHDNPTRANPPQDHFGINVETLEALQQLLARAKAFQQSNQDVSIDDYSVTADRMDVAPHRLHRFYVQFGTPCPLEVQYYEKIGAS
jgi:hypothetical protein